MRISPGGKTPISRRNRPDDPPSSATVTIAVIFVLYCFKPRSNVDSPVPAEALAGIQNLEHVLSVDDVTI